MAQVDLVKITFSNIALDDGDFVVCDGVLEVFGRKILCSGAGDDEAVAHTCMVSEACERFAYLCVVEAGYAVYPGGTTGFAAHLDPERAAESAAHELIERSFLDLLATQPWRQPDRSDSEKWSYLVPRHNLWCSIVRVRCKGTAGWGCAVHAERAVSIARAKREAAMMATSYTTYGRRGNAIAPLFRAASCLGGHIRIIALPTQIVEGKIRHIRRAVWEEMCVQIK